MPQILVKQEVLIPGWLKRVLEKAITTGHAGRRSECILVPTGVVSYRLCTKGYECYRCEFYQMIEEAGIVQ